MYGSVLVFRVLYKQTKKNKMSSLKPAEKSAKRGDIRWVKAQGNLQVRTY